MNVRFYISVRCSVFSGLLAACKTYQTLGANESGGGKKPNPRVWGTKKKKCPAMIINKI